MTGPCSNWESLLIDRVAGDLDLAGERRVEEHLATCPACRAESVALGEALSLARLPPVSAVEKEALGGADRAALARWKLSLRRRRAFAAATAAIAVAAAAIFVAVSPGLLHSSPPVARASSYWQVPDLDEAWSVAAIVGGSSSEVAEESSAGAVDDTYPDDALYAETEEIGLD